MPYEVLPNPVQPIFDAASAVLSVTGTVLTHIVGNPVLALGLGFSVVCGAIAVFRRLF